MIQKTAEGNSEPINFEPIGNVLGDHYRGRDVMVTGHTGFKGSWLCHWLKRMGARVHGIALDPNPGQTLFDSLDLGNRIQSDHRFDIRDRRRVADTIGGIQPNDIFHLAAQPLVRASYDSPFETFSVNVMGTASVLDAAIEQNNPTNVVVVTTDKCYENREWEASYRETDAMGGHDPYSASKGCAELVTSSYRRSFTNPSGSVRIASARAGNVIGGGDWAVDRIVPDVFRAVSRGEAVTIRNRTSTRPWQHVLEPLGGYLWLAAMLSGVDATSGSSPPPAQLCDGFNFGPSLDSNQTVYDLVCELSRHAPIHVRDASDPAERHEAGKLNLAIDRARHWLGWMPVWNFETTVKHTADFYVRAADGESVIDIATDQLNRYMKDAVKVGPAWSKPITRSIAA